MNMLRWIDDWNSIIRNVIFQDEELKSLMMVPEDTDIISFIDNYFIRAGYTNTLLENEKVRIVYADVPAADSTTPNVTKNVLSFDIYVNNNVIHNVGTDRLRMRTHLIADRLLTLLTKDRYIQETGYRFFNPKPYDGGSKTIGYARFTLLLNYMKVY